MASIEDKQSNGEPDDLSFLRTEDYICLNCSVVTQNGISRRMALAAEAFGNKMCFLEDITLENVTPDFPACIFVLEQALSVRALQEFVNSSENSNINTIQQSGHRTLLYGHAVQLRHLHSNMYLTCLSTSTSNDKLAFDVGLQLNSQGESCWWTIHPASKQRSEGEKVRIGDDIILVSVASERYLHIYSVDNIIHRVNASFQQTLWTLLPISSGNFRSKTTGFVFGGDVLRLFHGNMDQCFTLPQPGVSEFPYSIFYETGSVCNHARSLWRLEFLRTRWYGGFMLWNSLVRFRHITSGRYLGITNGEVCVVHRDKANADVITFILTPVKDDKKSNEIESEETMGMPTIKYGDTLVYVQHAKTSHWLSYQTYETKKRGIGKIEEKKATLHEEGHMDDCFTIVRAQEEEARSALVIRKCMSLFTKFIRAMDTSIDHHIEKHRYWKKISLEKVLKCLDDLIEFFKQPSEDISHEERQAKLKALRNRQDLFHEEGMITLVLDTIDKYSEYSETKNQTSKMNIQLFDGYKQQVIDEIYDQLYALLATMIKGNRNNCAQFAQGNRLDCLIGRLTSQQTSRGVLEVLHCILIDSPEALNMIKERHIQGIISLLDRNGRDPKVLAVLSSLCANNGIAVRLNQNLICENLLQRRDLLMQSRLIEQISCLRPNIMVGANQGESMYKKWYFEIEIDFVEALSDTKPHCRIGWASTEFHPTPDSADGFSCVGIGDDCYSYGFDGQNLWYSGRNKVINSEEFSSFKKGDVIGSLLDLSIPEIWFSLNGVPMKGFFREFNLSGMFYPVISVSPKISCRFLFGDEHGRFKFGPPEGCAPIYQAMLQKQKIRLEQCFSFGDMNKYIVQGPTQPLEQVAFTPNPVETSNIQMPNFIDGVRDRLAENLHEIWAMNKIEQGWRYAEIRNDLKKFHNCLCQFEMLPIDEKQYDTNLATETLRTMFAMGYQILMDNKQDQKRLKLIKLSNAFLQINGYKPQPLDLNNVVLGPKLEELVEKLAQNTHNVWAKERIKNGWTYGVVENPIQKRHPYLLPYDKVDPSIKKANRETALDTVKTLLAYGYIIESPNLELEESIRKKKNVDSNDISNHRFTTRTYRAEKTFAIKSGKWYYEVEILTMGGIKIGWSEVNCLPITDISADPQSYSFDSLNAVKWHHTSDPFGKKCQPGDVIGVMIDLQDKTISFSLNGEVLMDSVGSESAFENISIGEGYIPAFSLGFGQKIRPNFGQDVNSLKYFTNCGLQEGYEPFAVNMTKHVTLWYTNELPVFEYIDDNHDTLEITRNIGSESLPYIKIVSKLFGTEKTKMEYLRLSIPIAFRDEFISRSKVREKRIQALHMFKSQTEDETENQPIFNFDQPEIDYKNDKSRSSTLERNLGQGQSNSAKPLSSLFNKITHKQHRSKSPFKFMNRLSREASPNISSNQNIKSLAKNDKNSASKSKISRSTEFGIKSSLVNHVTNPLPKTSTLQKEVYSGKSQAQLEDLIEAELDQHLAETDEAELQAIIDYVDEYYYGVRIFPGQDATKVFVGWTGSRFHLLNEKMDKNFDHGLVSKCTLINTSNDGSIVSSLVRKECYVVSAAELIQNSTQPDTQLSKKISNSILLGCLIELSTGFLTFTVNGKETIHKFQVEPGTKLYPAVFVEPTTKEILQIELGRVRNCLPLSAALFPSLGKHIEPRLPPRLRIQYLKSIRWSRVPNSNLKVHCLKMNNILGWSLLCEETVYNQAIYIPERDRWISVLELNENEKYREFFHNLLMLYEAICAQSNNYVAHQLCNQIDEKQLMYCIQNSYLNGHIRRRFYDLLIKLHLESFAVSRQMTKYEFVIPLNSKLSDNRLVDHKELMKNGKFPKRDDFVSVRPSIISESQIKNETQKLYLVPPSFNIEALKQFVLSSFPDSVKLCISHVRDPTGGSNSFLFVPLIKLLNQLLVMDVFSEQDLHLLMAYLDPTKFISESVSISEGLLSANLEDEIKYEICLFLHSLCDYVLRFRVEAVVSFSSNYVNVIQCDQKRRYNELKESSLPSALMAKKTKEFRCPAKDQMQSLVNFKSSSHQIDLSEDIKNKLADFHSSLNQICQIKQRDEQKIDDNQVDGSGFVSKIVKVLFSSEYSEIAENQEQMEPTQENLMAICEEASQNENSHNALSLLITENVVDWAKNSFISNEDLIREMFGLIYRQYNSLGELAECLPKTYVIAETSIKDVTNLLQSLSIVRGLLSVQMSQIEEDIMKSCLNEIMDNKIFFQHPDLMRALCVHETVMQVMINWLNRRQHQQDVVGDMMTNMDNQESAINSNQLTTSQQGDEQPKEENAELVVVCCKFLSYFCRTSRHNQRAMFEHLSYLLDNSAMLLARPSLRGSCPLDVACSSLMDNNDLSLALRESDLEKIAAYLSRCGLQTNSELFAKGYPDIGWDPVEGERFLDFLKFCVWVNGDSVEENANLIVRLLIRRPECLGPALRGEGGGLLKATIDGIRMSLQIAATQNVQNPVVMATALDAESEMSIDFLNNNKFDFSRIPPEDDEDYIDIGEAILSFYASLVELLGRCAPSEETIKMGKSDSIRARSILRSLVSMEDLEGFLSLRFILPIPGLSEHLPGIQSSHKMSIVLFLERVYGIPDQTTFFRLLETGFLPDIRCATILDSSTCAEGDMPLALNRYLCCSVLPLLTSYAHYFDAAENKASLMETVLNTVYRLSKCKSLTNGQLDVVSEFLISFTNQMKPPMMKNLLKKLIEDLPTLEEYTIVPLKMLTLWYERCGRYYGASPIGQATEEEKKLTMTLFTRIFDSLARRTYDPELFSKALPCLSAIGCALSPDYSYTVCESDLLNYQSGNELTEMQRSSHFTPIPLNITNIILTQDFEDVIKIYSEHVHDLWSYNKFDQNWSYGQSYSDSERLHPSLKNYQNMSRKDQLKYEDLTRDTLKAIKVLGWSIEKSETVPNNLKNASRMVLKKLKDGVVSNGYMPKPFDLSSITLTKEQDDLGNTLAINCHHIWSRKKKNELENVGAALHHLLVPYELLTDRERASDLQFTFGLVKFLILNGYRLQNIESSLNEKRLALNTMHHDESDKVNHDRTEIRFAFNLLEKLLEYVDKAALNMQSIKESAKFSRKSSFKTSGGDVKFFTKVVLPLIEKYFQSHRSYFILKSSSNKPGLGCATAKEKEMTCSLFCKLALLLRKKMSCFGSDTNITVRCLQVLIRAVDVSSVIKNSQEIVRASLLPFFSYAADDLSSIIDDLTNNRLSNIKGTSQKTSASLDYIHMVLLPVLASMFDHLGVNKYGTDVLTGEIQLASYKILNALWILGTLGTKLVDREWIVSDLSRHRPLIGECLGSFATSFPIAFLEPEFNLNNKYSIMYGLTESNLSEHSLEAQDVMAKLSKNLPLLNDIISEIGHLCESGGKYEDAPHVIEILLPTLCSYLHYWWDHGPSAKSAETKLSIEAAASQNQKKPETTSEAGPITGVTSQIMNKTLGYILKLISNNLDEREASWMNRIASFSQLIIANSTSDLLEDNFLPVSGLIAEKARDLYQKEMSIRTLSKNATQRENIESDVQRELEIIIRNIYAFYPLLIKYVDLHRAYWLKNPDEKSQKLYYDVAEVFTIWLKSKMFKREEINFVSANNIDNMILIMPNKVSGLSSATSIDPTGAKSRKKRAKSQKSQAKKFTSLIVAGLKRLFQLGINFFEGKEQELIQMAKQKFIDIKTGLLSETLMINGKKVSTASTINQDDTLNLELNKDQEDIVADFIGRYLKSSDLICKDENSINDTIEKETYQKTKWQRVLYRKIASKRHLISTMRNLSQETIIEKIMEIAKVLYGLHMVEHPQTKAKGIWRKLISGQRKKAVMACFRMAPLYSLPHHRAINLFLKSYRQNWLDNEAENQTDIGCLVPDLCPKMAKVDELEAGEEAVVQVVRPDPLTQLIACFNRAATTQQTGTHGSANLADDQLYQMFADKMSKSCEIVDEDEEEEEEKAAEEQAPSDDDQLSAFQLAEMQKQKLLFEQDRLAERGAAQMCLLYVSASRGEKTQMLEKTLELGISMLHGGNVNVQKRMLKHLKDKKDVGFFTSLAGLMSNCSVLDLDTFERCIKAEQFGGVTVSDSDSGMAGKKNLHDADFTCTLFRFLQLLCEGHNLEFQNYLRAQAGNNTTVNIIICTVDYLLRLQESLMDFYWHYSGKSTVDAAGKDNFCRAINVAKQVFNTLTEYIQGPCVGNQLTLAHSRLWDAIGGFLYIFANLQDKLSKDPHQIELLRELMKLQKDMIIMLLSMLEGNVLNGPIGKQMVDTLIENQQNVEMLLKFFDIFLKMKDLTTSEAFQEFDSNGDGWISPKEFRRAMEAQKMYSSEEIDYILMCVDTNQDGKIDFNEFTERFHNPAKDIGFNMAVLLTNLSEHMSHEARFERLMKKASSFLSYFEPFLGRIEITGSSGRIERVYFEIKESNIEQWNKPQIKESKRQFLYDIVNEGDDKEKLEQFVNFCEDTIFEMQHAASISSSGEDDYQTQDTNKQSVLKTGFQMIKTGLLYTIDTLSPNRLKQFFNKFRNMGKMEVAKWCAQIGFSGAVFLVGLLFHLFCLVFKCVYLMIVGHSEAKSETKSEERRISVDGKSRRPEEMAEERQSRRDLELVDEKEECESGEKDESKAAVLRDDDDEVIVLKSGPVPSPSSSNAKKILAMFARNFYKLKYLALILAFLINFLMLFYKAKKLNSETMSELTDDDDIEETNLIEVIMVDQDEYYIEHLLKSLAFMHSLVAFGIMVAYYVLKVPLVIFKREKEIARKLEFQGLWIAEQPDDDDLKSHWDKLVLGTRSFPDMYWDKFIKKKVKSKYAEQFDMQQLNKLLGIDAKFDEYNFDEVSKASGENGQNANESKGLISRLNSIDWKYQIWKWGVIFTDNLFLYVFWYFCFSVIGNFNYFFFACHLSDVAISIKTLTTILKSITHNGKQLLLTIMLMSIVVYMYTVIAFNFFRKFYSKEEDGELEENCQDLFTCFKFHLYIGIRSGGGIGDELESPVGDDKEFYRILFDITFFFFIIVILLAIIQGLIIDAFGELRDQLEQVKESLEANCFICGIGKEYFDKVPHGFEIHTMREHNFANYMFFLMHLINKPDTEYTGQETYVSQLYQQRCWEFFPTGDCFRKQHEGDLEQN